MMRKKMGGLPVWQVLFKDRIYELLNENGNYGNTRQYAFMRLKRDAPEAAREWLLKLYDLHDVYYEAVEKEDAAAQAKARQAFDAHYRTMRAVAKQASVVTEPDKLEKLMRAWDAANLEDRQAFLALCSREIEAAEDGELVVLDAPPTRIGPAPFRAAEGAEIPDLEALLKADMTVSEVARRLGVSYRTVCRWRSGKTKPSGAILEKLAAMAQSPAA
jgi:hypothetical protein